MSITVKAININHDCESCVAMERSIENYKHVIQVAQDKIKELTDIINKGGK